MQKDSEPYYLSVLQRGSCLKQYEKNIRGDDIMQELMKKLMEAGKTEAFDSMEALSAAAKEMGYTDEQIDKAMEDFDGFPLDDDDLDEIAGGYPPAWKLNTTYRDGEKLPSWLWEHRIW